MAQTTTVLVIGAGPTGLTLACDLARRGVPFRIVEAAAGPQPGSRGKGVQPRTLEMFEDLGIAERVLAHGHMAMPMISIGPDGVEHPGGAVPESLLGRPDIPYPASLITPEWRVEEALRDLLTGLGGGVEFGSALVGFEQGDDSITATLEHDGVTEPVTARWIVGCDGGHSVVRKQTGVAFHGETRENVRMMIADVRVDGIDRDAWRIWRGTAGMATLCPLPSTDLFQFLAAVTPGVEPDLDLANLQRVLDEVSGRSDVRLSDPEWTSLWRANVRIVERYRIGNAFLAGDAAHIHSPAGGQGMNTGIQDSANLGWKLAAVAAGADESLLDTYEDERRPVAAHVLAMSDAKLAQAAATRQMSTTRDESTIQLDVGYRGSQLSVDDRGDDARLRAGDRLPDATGMRTAGGEHRLFDLLRGGRWGLIRFGDAPVVDVSAVDARVLTVVERPVSDGEVADTDGHLRAAVGAGDRTLVLVRPDGYVSAISDADDPSAVRAILARVA